MSGHKWRGHHAHSSAPSSLRLASSRGILCFILGAVVSLTLVSWHKTRPLSLPSFRLDTDTPLSTRSRESEIVDRTEAHGGTVEGRGRAVVPPGEAQGFVSRVELGEIARKLARNGTVIMTVSNHGYQDFLENWMAHAQKLGLHKHLLVVAEDAQSWAHVQQRWPGQAVRIHVPELEDADEATQRALGLQGAGSSGGSASEFNSPRFKQMMYRRVFYIRELLYARVNVLLTDTDIVFLQNPLPIILAATAGRTAVASSTVLGESGAEAPFDFLGMLDEPDQRGFQHLEPYPVPRNASLQYLTKSNVCGGFLFFRCTPAAWVMVDLLAMKLFRGARTTGKENEQTFLALVLWEALRLQPAARVGILPQQLFVPGWLFFKDSKYQWWRQRFRRDPKNEAVIVHNNWVMGREAKIKRFVEKKLWALPGPRDADAGGRGAIS